MFSMDIKKYKIIWFSVYALCFMVIIADGNGDWYRLRSPQKAESQQSIPDVRDTGYIGKYALGESSTKCVIDNDDMHSSFGILALIMIVNAFRFWKKREIDMYQLTQDAGTPIIYVLVKTLS